MRKIRHRLFGHGSYQEIVEVWGDSERKWLKRHCVCGDIYWRLDDGDKRGLPLWK